MATTNDGQLRDIEATRRELKRSVERSRELVEKTRRQLEQFLGTRH